MERKTSPNVATIQRLYDALCERDPAGLAAVCDPQVSWEITPGFPYGGTFIGIESVFKDFFAPLGQAFEDWRPEVENILDAGDEVIGLGRYRTRAKATGKVMTAGFAHVWSVQDGKVIRLRQYADTVQLVEK